MIVRGRCCRWTGRAARWSSVPLSGQRLGHQGVPDCSANGPHLERLRPLAAVGALFLKPLSNTCRHS
eukprot:scaffold327721_cov53-Tisochrysis_lutea.AAC.2